MSIQIQDTTYSLYTNATVNENINDLRMVTCCENTLQAPEL
jgi:hypothetical protein